MQVDEAVQTRVSEVSDASQAPQQQSGAATPLTQEVGDPSNPDSSQPAVPGMEKNYTDTIESLLSELWKERLVRDAVPWCCFATPKPNSYAASNGRHMCDFQLLQSTSPHAIAELSTANDEGFPPWMRVDYGHAAHELAYL